LGKTPLYGFFPYLRTSETVVIRGVGLKDTRQLHQEAEDVRAPLESLRGMFRTHDGAPIEDMIYTVHPAPPDGASQEKLFKQLQEVQLLVAYLYTTPHPAGGTILSSDHASFFLFRPERIPLTLSRPSAALDLEKRIHLGESEGGFVQGFDGARDWNCHFWVSAGSAVYPSTPYFWRNDYQDLSSNFREFLSHSHNWPLEDLCRRPVSDDVTHERVFVALQWYARSCRYAADDAERLLALAIALESLLWVREGERLTERFKDAVLTVLGPVPRLDSWLEQFYQARSKTVHEGRPHQLAFFAADRGDLGKLRKGQADLMPHGTLLEYGLRIFRMCLCAILSGAALAEEQRLSELFVHHSERLKKICTCLRDTTRAALERLAGVRQDMSDLCDVTMPSGELLALQPGVTLEQLFGTCSLVLKTLQEASPKLSPEGASLLAEAVSEGSKGSPEQLKRLEALATLLQKELQAAEIGVPRAVVDGVCSFLHFMSSPGFSIRVLWAHTKDTPGGES
jgi:hypothetical protein